MNSMCLSGKRILPYPQLKMEVEMKLSEKGPITQSRLMFDGSGTLNIVNVNDEVAKLEGENEVLRKKSESADRLIDETSKALLTAIDALLEKQA